LGGLEPHNPAYMHPEDLAQLGLNAGDMVELSSPDGRVVTIAALDKGLRRGCVSISHGFGRNPDELESPDEVGCNVGRLLNTDIDFDPLTGIPRMSGVSIAVAAAKGIERPHNSPATVAQTAPEQSSNAATSITKYRNNSLAANVGPGARGRA
jgi:hypothetical protein